MFVDANKRKVEIEAAKEICRACPVRVQCGDAYLSHPTLIADRVVAGGMTAKERLRIALQRRRG